MTTIAPTRHHRCRCSSDHASRSGEASVQDDAVANAAAASLWDGDEGMTWSRDWERWDRALARYQAQLLGAAAIRRGEHILDVGCGNGASSRGAARHAVHGTVLGVDLSTRMLERAAWEARSEDLSNVQFRRADAQVHPFRPEQFDLVISRFGSMFFGDPVAAFANLARATRPGGRFVSVVWQGFQENEWLREINSALCLGQAPSTPPPGAPGPLSQADPSITARVLHAAGFGSIYIDPVLEPLWLGADAEEATEFISTGGLAQCLIEGLDPSDRERAMQSLRSTVEDHVTADGVIFGSAAWVISARRPGC